MANRRSEAEEFMGNFVRDLGAVATRHASRSAISSPCKRRSPRGR